MTKENFNCDLYFCRMDLDDCEDHGFNDFTVFNAWVLAEVSHDVVYLVNVHDKIFITHDIADILHFVESMVFSSHPIRSKFDFVDIYLQEYESYEEAYKVALGISAIHELCYSK